jgi:hypothetical protein
VLPVETEGNTHTISFENAFSFHPDVVSHVIDSVIDATGLTRDYIVQFVTCDSNLVAHSYKVSSGEESVLACKGRSQPWACYYLKIIDLNKSNTKAENTVVSSETEDYSDIYKLLILLTLTVLALFGVIVFLLQRNKKSGTYTELIQIGKYHFNPISMELILNNEKVELTSKETDLLHLLCVSVNSTVEREAILNKVWGDDGDYVGRTLDVFISKLRKKLEADSSIKIANIRGVGYKLIIDA